MARQGVHSEAAFVAEFYRNLHGSTTPAKGVQMGVSIAYDCGIGVFAMFRIRGKIEDGGRQCEENAKQDPAPPRNAQRRL